MPSVTGSSRRGGRRWTRLGLLLVLAFVVHDLLMAAPAPAAAKHAHPAVTAPATHHAASGPAAHLDNPDPAHPAGCDTVTAAVHQSPGSLDLDHDNPIVPVGLAHTTGRPHQRPDVTAWDQPYWPPGIRRALFQTYLI